MVIGPFGQLNLPDGSTADFFILRYGPNGELLSPQTREILANEVAAASDIFLFSHGWNNTFDQAARIFQRFIDGYARQTTTRPAGYRPLLIGVVWPSISFLMPWDDDGPQIAGDPTAGSLRDEEMRGFVGGSVDIGAEARLSELVDGRTRISAAEARQAAEIVRDGLLVGSSTDDGSLPPTVDEVLEAWAVLDGGAAAKPADPDAFGDVAVAPDAAVPQAAGGLGRFDPRNLLRMGTVWKMKDRAGKVGGLGVAPLVVEILDGTQARLHLIGHSFGARVVLSALAMRAVTRPARSMLLLQPAINRWCFAPDVVGTGRAGGYHRVLDRVELPILSTMSTHDLPLHDAFHLALRGSNLGEPAIAAVGDTDRYGALGGYGPAGLGTLATRQTVLRPGATEYDLTSTARVIALDGSGDLDGAPAIGGHSDISTPRTWWALHCLTNAPVIGT
jgi:hypothetical protein